MDNKNIFFDIKSCNQHNAISDHLFFTPTSIINSNINNSFDSFNINDSNIININDSNFDSSINNNNNNSNLNNDSNQSRFIQKGVVLLPNFLNSDKQLEMLKELQKPNHLRRMFEKNDQFSKFIKVLYLHKDKNNIATILRNSAESAAVYASSFCSTIPTQFDVTVASAYSYRVIGGRHLMRCDNIPGWAILICLGCTIRMSIRGPEMEKPKQINLSSGDVLVFNSSKTEQIARSVNSIIRNSSPNHFTIEDDLVDKSLLIQLRSIITKPKKIASEKKQRQKIK
eukprot:TRINITY_DN2005_c1_g3_i2.p1 TRINITY_DN2005_c1_g3~~TRINITY_DN2005_c1_g3_i2.p1  ORF type:complete len:284 (-),score=109.28 TRINITY_DN2005_c1_g3_i2:91-942(-)